MSETLTSKHCTSCEGRVPPLDPGRLAEYRRQTPKWELSDAGRRIRRSWRVKDFVTALDFFERIGKLAEAEGHHPDLHLSNYRDVSIEIWTHALGGLSENDFILAAKIDQLPVALKN